MTWFLVLDLTACDNKWPNSFLSTARISLREGETVGALKLSGVYRLSPIFPLLVDSWVPDNALNEIKFVEFYHVPSAFKALARLTAKLPDEDLSPFAFSLGTVPVLSVSSASTLDRVRDVLGDDFSYERWTIGPDGRLDDVHCAPQRQDSVRSAEIIRLSTECESLLQNNPDYAHLPEDIRGVVDEFILSVATLIPELVRVIPAEAETLMDLVKEVQRLEDILLKATSDGSGTSDEDQQRIVHQVADRIVQINSSLSYVSSQYTAGAIPILARRALIRRYSLLGVGTAAKGLVHLVRHFNSALSEGRVESAIEDAFRSKISKPLPGLFTSRGFDSSKWDEFNVSRVSAGLGATAPRVKLPFFSGRLGFRETEYSVSAALQSLWAGDALEWSLLTMTHEILHGHVRNLLAHLFQEFAGTNDRFEAIYEKLVRVSRQQPVSLTTLESIQVAILIYCAQTPLWGSLSAEPDMKELLATGDHGKEMPLPSPHALHGILEAEHRNISEIFVHVLDLNYVFGGQLNPYLQYLWRSWGAVPTVGEDPRHYVLRSLFAAASTTSGLSRERYDDALAKLRGAVQGAVSSHASYDLTGRVAAFLDANANSDSLYFPFEAGLRIVDIVRKVFFSDQVRQALIDGDPLVEQLDPRGAEFPLQYNLGELEMLEIGVASPSAFLWDRIDRLLKADIATQDIERRTAWVLLAMASNQGD